MLFRRYAEERRQADLDELFRYFQPLARRLSRQYIADQERSEDLDQVANLGLLKALQRFDPDRGFAFSSFAVPTILGELKRSFRDSSWAVHVPRRVQERSAEIRSAQRRLELRLGRAPTVSEIKAETGFDDEAVVEAFHALDSKRSLSLDAPVRADDDEAALGDQLGGIDPGYERTADLDALEHALPALSGTQREVIRMRFEDDMKQADIATRLGVSQMQISRVLASGLERLQILVEHQSSPRTARSLNA
jgi:RNA polymerase sigma-B factor